VNTHKFQWFLLLPGLTLSACTGSLPEKDTQATNRDQTQLHYLGRDPEHGDRSIMSVKGLQIVVFDGVPHPSADSLHLLTHARINPGESVLDLGTGTGIQAIFAARKVNHVVATDINPRATANTQYNIQKLGLQNKIEARTGDLFAALKANERFDVILFNLRYPGDGADSPLWHVHQRFFAGVKKHLLPGGRIYYQFGFLRNLETVEKMLLKNHLQITDRKMNLSPDLHGAFFLTLEIRPIQ